MNILGSEFWFQSWVFLLATEKLLNLLELSLLIIDVGMDGSIFS